MKRRERAGAHSSCHASLRRLTHAPVRSATGLMATPMLAPEIEVLKTDMNDEMSAALLDISQEAFSKNKLHKDVATFIKSNFDKKYPPADNKATSGVYHCIVGSHWSCSVTYETGKSWYAHHKSRGVKVMIFKSKDSPYD